MKFTNALFVIDIDESELDTIISESDQIMIKQEFNCYCFNVKRDPLYYRVQGSQTKKLTNRYVIEELIKQKMNLECNHMFLKGFIQNTECQFELDVGS
tara:strand:- start:594 stop:887 length:294 start_codon:yes stop_codon:yes gene_type:complete